MATLSYEGNDPWLHNIRSQIKARDSREIHLFRDVFDDYNQLQMELALCKSQTKAAAASGGASGGADTSHRQYIIKLTAENEILSRDLALMDERNRNNENMLIRREMRINELLEMEKKCALVSNYLTASNKQLTNAGHKIEELQSTIVELTKKLKMAQDENARLTTTLAMGQEMKQRLDSQFSASSNIISSDDLQIDSVAWHVKKPSRVPDGIKYCERLSADPKTSINCVTYHGHGNAIVSGTTEGRIIFTQARTGKLGNTIEVSRHPITSIASSPSHSNVAFTDSDKLLYLFNTLSRVKPSRVTLPNMGLETSFLSAQLLSVINKGRVESICLYNIDENNGLSLEQKINTTSTPTAMATHDTTLGLVTSHLDRSVTVWTMANQLQPLLTIDSVHSLRITSVQYHPSDNLILTNSWDSKMNVIDTRAGSIVQTINGATVGYVNKLEKTRATFCNDGIYIAAGSSDGTVKIWDTRKVEGKDGVKVDQSGSNNGLVKSLGHPSIKSPITDVKWNYNGCQVVAADQSANLIIFE